MGLRAGHPESAAHYVEWTIEMARAAGLAGRGAWRSYPRALLLARASTDLARMAFPDVVKGLGHVPDAPEVAEDWTGMADATGLPDEPAPAPTRQLQWNPPSAPTMPASGPASVPWDDDPPETPEAVKTATLPPPAEPVAADESERPVDRENVRRIMAAYGDLPFGDDRDTRLALFSAVLGFGVTSTNDLERMAGYRLLGALTKLRDGTLIAIADGHGGFTIHAGAEPPEEDATP
jgi:hypothetical protein